jgi:hypothetical protein
MLAGLKWKCLVVYTDDIIVFSPTFEAHVADLKSVFKRLADANVKINPSKCEFFLDVISTEGCSPTQTKSKLF